MLDPIRYFRLMRLGPITDVLSMSRISAYPRLSKFVMIVGPLRDEVRISLVAILLKPSLDIGCYELSFLRSAGIGNNRS